VDLDWGGGGGAALSGRVWLGCSSDSGGQLATILAWNLSLPLASSFNSCSCF
jgi:hypothetical protein